MYRPTRAPPWLARPAHLIPTPHPTAHQFRAPVPPSLTPSSSLTRSHSRIAGGGYRRVRYGSDRTLSVSARLLTLRRNVPICARARIYRAYILPFPWAAMGGAPRKGREGLGGSQEGDGGRQEAGGERERACPLKKASGVSMASSTVRRGRDRRAVENGYGGWGYVKGRME